MRRAAGLVSVLAGARRHQRTLAGIVDQGVVGLGNLAVGLLVLRASTKEEYGLYSLCYMTLILLNGFSGALFAAQLTVSYHAHPGHRRAELAAAMLWGQAMLGASLALSGLAAALLLPGTVLPDDVRRLVLVSALACPALAVHDFLRSYFFLVDRATSAVALDVLLVAGWSVGTVLLGVGLGSSHTLGALAALGLTACATVCTGLALARLPLQAGWRGLREGAAVSWQHGRWALAGAAVTALQNQGHVYLLGALGSARAIAELSAARMLMTPMSLLILGVGRTLTPTLARLAAEGEVRAMRRHANRALGGVVAAVCLYGTVLVLGRDVLIGHVLGEAYAGIGPLVVLWTVILVLQAVDANLSAVVQVARRFRELAMINAWTVGPVLIGVVPMILLYGAEGNLVALAAGYAGVALLLRREARRAMTAIEARGG